MNELEKNELAALLLSKDKEIRILAINYLTSINKGTFTVYCFWDFDKNNSYKIYSIVSYSNSTFTIFDLLSWIIEQLEFFTIQAILDLINLIIENNEIKNED